MTDFDTLELASERLWAFINQYDVELNNAGYKIGMEPLYDGSLPVLFIEKDNNRVKVEMCTLLTRIIGEAWLLGSFSAKREIALNILKNEEIKESVFKVIK